MCMYTVERCAVLPPTLAWKDFDILPGRGPTNIFMIDRGEVVLPYGVWLQADPIGLYAGHAFNDRMYVSGFHTFGWPYPNYASSPGAGWSQRRIAVILRGIAWWGIQTAGEAGWTAQEMLIVPRGDPHEWLSLSENAPLGPTVLMPERIRREARDRRAIRENAYALSKL